MQAMASGTVEIFNDSSLPLDISGLQLSQAVVSSIFSDFHKTLGWLNVVLMNSATHTALNIKHLNHDYETDVLTFDFSEEEVANGEIYINVEVAKENADLYKTTLQNELYRLIIHGALHLVGINDKTEEEEANMRDHEDKYLKCFM